MTLKGNESSKVVTIRLFVERYIKEMYIVPKSSSNKKKVETFSLSKGNVKISKVNLT